MHSALIFSLVMSLVLTLVLEVGFFLFAGRLFTTGKRSKKDLLLVIMVNVLTNPVVVLSYWLSFYYTNWNLTLVKIPLEAFAVLVEWWYYRKYGEGFRRPFFFSLSANAFSFFTGLLIQGVF